MTKLTPSVKRALNSLEARFAGFGQDIDMIKHSVRQMQWSLRAVVQHLHVNVPPDLLDATVEPSPEFINKIVAEARFAGTTPVPKKARKRKKRR